MRVVQALAAGLDDLDADQQQDRRDLVGAVASDALEAERAGFAVLDLPHLCPDQILTVLARHLCSSSITG